MTKNIICFIDDNVQLLDLYRTFFKSNKKITFYGTNDVDVFLDFIQNHNVKLIFIDIELGRISGIDVAKKVKQINNNVMITALSGYVFQDKIDFFDNILTKPINLSDLENYVYSNL